MRFRWLPKSTTLVDPEMTLDGKMHSVALHTCFTEPTTKIWMKIDPYYQQQKCSPWILVSSKISFLRIFAGVRWGGGVKWEWGGRKWRFFVSFGSLYFPNCNIQCHNYYTVIYSRLRGFQWHRNRWPWMTLNGYFALKLVFGSTSNSLTYSGFQTKLLGNLQSYIRIYFQRQKCSPRNAVSGSIL